MELARHERERLRKQDQMKRKRLEEVREQQNCAAEASEVRRVPRSSISVPRVWLFPGKGCTAVVRFARWHDNLPTSLPGQVYHDKASLIGYFSLSVSLDVSEAPG